MHAWNFQWTLASDVTWFSGYKPGTPCLILLSSLSFSVSALSSDSSQSLSLSLTSLPIPQLRAHILEEKKVFESSKLHDFIPHHCNSESLFYFFYNAPKYFLIGQGLWLGYISIPEQPIKANEWEVLIHLNQQRLYLTGYRTSLTQIK